MVVGKPFQPGQSGNPAGRPKYTTEWREQCRKWAMEEGGIQILKGIAEGRGNPKDQLNAVQFLIDHGMGKAVTQIAGVDDEEFAKLRIVIERDEPAVGNKEQ